jgi:plasmid maintenance system antidote protein VapI
MTPMQRKPAKLSDQIRHAIETCGRTRYAIAKATGISQPTLSRFISGERGLPMKTLDRLAGHLGLEIIIRKKG